MINANPSWTRCVQRQSAADSAVFVALLVLGGCGSSPEVNQPIPQEAVETTPREPEPPAAQTFPLEGPAPSSTPSATTTPPSTSAVAEPAAVAKAAKKGGSDASATATTEPPLPPEAVQQFDNAVAMVNAGNVSAAEQAFQTLSTAYPAYSGPLVNLGILQAKSGKLDEAEKTFKTAIERKADNASAYNQLGIVYRRQGRFKEADEAYSRAVQIDPNYANAHLNLGVLCDLYLQQPQRALEAFERYLSLSPTPDEKVSGWVKELKVRLGAAARASGAGS
jgi:predicted Zn-dependent protease